MYYPELSRLISENPYLPPLLVTSLDQYFASLTQVEADTITTQFVASAMRISNPMATNLLDRCVDIGLLQKGVQFACPTTGDLLNTYWDNEEIPDSIDCYSCDAAHESNLCQAQDIYKLLRILEAVPRRTDGNAIPNLIRVFDRFHTVAVQLTKRHDGRATLHIDDEYDVQDLLHALLRVHFDDIRPEEYTPSYAAGASRIDFDLKPEKIVIEAKKSRHNLRAKEIADQLIIDIARYQTHPDCGLLFCFVYDPEGIIPNPKALENDLTKIHNGMQVIVFIRPSFTT